MGDEYGRKAKRWYLSVMESEVLRQTDSRVEAEADLFMRDMSEKNWFADVLSDVTFLICGIQGQARKNTSTRCSSTR